MKLLDRYIAKHVFMAITIVSLVIIGLDFIFSFLAEVDELKGDYKTINALWFVLYLLPRHFYEYMPFAALIGCLLGLGVLADHRELTVMRAAGVSITRIGVAVMLPVFVFLVINLSLGEYVAPPLQQIAETQKDILRSREEVVSSQRGYWHRDGNQYIHFNAADPRGTLYGVTVYSFAQDRRLDKVFFAKNANFSSANNSWTLHQIEEVTLTSSGSSLQTQETSIWQTTLTPIILKALVLKSQNQSISDLYLFAHYLAQQGLATGRYWLAFWNKVLQPLAIVSLVLVSMSFVFGSLRSATMGFRVFCAIAVGLLFSYSQDMLGAISLVYGLSPLVAAALPVLFCGVLGGYLLKKAG